MARSSARKREAADDECVKELKEVMSDSKSLDLLGMNVMKGTICILVRML